MARIFLSHSSANDAEAVALRDWLIGEGWDDLFLDLDPTRGIAAGERWELALNEAANRCEAVLFLVSHAWLSSRWCLKELSLAAKLNKRVFGVIVEDIPIEALPADLTATHQLVNLAAGSDHVMLGGRGRDGSEVRVTFSQSGLAKLKTGLMRAGLDARFFLWPPEDDAERSPYRGLKPLEAEDAGIFFGREAPTIEALDKLRGLAEGASPRLMAILGASGAGKSSFLRAGLAPRLMRDDRSFQMLPIVRPERRALHGEAGLIRCLEEAAKARALGKSRADIRATVEAGPAAIAALLDELASKAAVPDLDSDGSGRRPRVVLAIDQGEELFLSEGCDEAAAFLALIRDLATGERSNLIVLFTIRSDSFEQLQTAPELDGLSLQTFNLPPMPRGAYQTVIEGPAKRLADTERTLTIEPALTEALLADIEAGGGKDALPLLAFTLERLYEEYGTGGKATLTLAQYRALGGIRGSIEAAVKDALKAADADPAVPKDEAARLALLRRALIPWLAGIDLETGAPRRRVARLSEIPAEARQLVQHLIAARLLSTDVAPDTGERTVEPAHEALLRQWGLLQGWLEEDFAALSALEGVKRAARDWAANDKDEAWLAHTAGRLEDAEAVARRDDFVGMLEPTDRAYLAAARAADTARRNHELEEARKLAEANRRIARRTRFGLVGALCLALVAGGAAFFAKRQADFAAEQQRVAVEREDYAKQQQAIAERETANAKAEKEEAQRQKVQAEAQAQRADRTVAAASRAVNIIAFDVSQKLRSRGVPIFVLRAVIDPVLNLGKALIDAGEVSTELQGDYALALDEAVQTYMTAGDLAAATKAAEDELTIRRALARNTSDLAAQRALSVSLNKVGGVRLRQGNLAGALQAEQESLEIARTLARDTNNAAAQRDLCISLSSVGDVKVREHDLTGALQAYQESLAIDRDLARDTNNLRAQRDLSIGLDRVADVEAQQKDYAGALQAYEESLVIRRGLARDAGNAEAQRDLLISLEKIADVKVWQNDIAGALPGYLQSLVLARNLARDTSNAEAQGDLGYLVGQLGHLAYKALIARDFVTAATASDRAFEADPRQLWLLPTNGAALMFLHRSQDARRLYLTHRGQMVNKTQTWEAAVLASFDQYRQAGLADPLMDEIATDFLTPTSQ